MKYIAFIFALFVCSSSVIGQRENPVKWDITKKTNDDGITTLTFKANISKGWVIYGLDYIQDGPIATSINFDENAAIELIDDIKSESEVIIVEEDDMFGLKLSKYKGEAIFHQRVKAIKKGAELTGYVTFMTCDGERCLPPTDVDFNFVLD